MIDDEAIQRLREALDHLLKTLKKIHVIAEQEQEW
jgi:hypothetical protein